MPCYEIRTISVEFKIENIELLKKAIEKINFWSLKNSSDTMAIIRDDNHNRIVIDFKNSKVSSEAYSEKELGARVNQLKQSYSEIVIGEIAKKQKWIQKKISERKFQLQRF